jgi:hypothetical protein
MKYSTKIFLSITLIAATIRPLQAQFISDDESKINSNLGFVISAPLSTTADVVNSGWGVAAGVGYNFNRRNALIGEFMWNRLSPNGQQLQPLRAAALQASNLDGNSDLYVISGNYRFELRGEKLGTYVIGGVGWYHRASSLSREVTSGVGTTCTSAWLWWGFSCESGTVVSNQTIASSSASSWGANGGLGFTVRVGEAPYRVYVESRYHYVPFQGLTAKFVAVGVGIRY